MYSIRPLRLKAQVMKQVTQWPGVKCLPLLHEATPLDCLGFVSVCSSSEYCSTSLKRRKEQSASLMDDVNLKANYSKTQNKLTTAI